MRANGSQDSTTQAQRNGERQSGEKERAREIVARLHTAYPDARCSLNFTTPLELLVATVLSAQCTDERVNQVTERLFAKYPSAQAFADAPLEELEQDIKQTGFYRNKAKHVHEAGRQIVERFDGEVPRTMEELTSLPGVARKTANVVLGNAYGIVEGIVVDTHVSRLSQRLGLTAEQEPAKIEQDLMALLAQSDWLDFSHLLIYHGRAVCQARAPKCAECTLLDLCPTGAATLSAAGDVAVEAVAAPARKSTRTLAKTHGKTRK
ncbi:MAG TPA: endonuclease III [Ktedonobacterales bacterium]